MSLGTVLVQLKSLCESGGDRPEDLTTLTDIANEMRKLFEQDQPNEGTASNFIQRKVLMKGGDLPDISAVEGFLDKEGISCSEHTLAYAFVMYAAIMKNEKTSLKQSLLKNIEALVEQAKYWHIMVGSEFCNYLFIP